MTAQPRTRALRQAALFDADANHYQRAGNQQAAATARETAERYRQSVRVRRQADVMRTIMEQCPVVRGEG